MSSMTEPTSLRSEILTLMDRGLAPLDDVAFNDLALRVFRFQFEHSGAYRKYCERRKVDAGAITNWLQVPAVPTAAFKVAALFAGDARAAQAVFRTSGTTRGPEQRGEHYVLDTELYERSLLPTFEHFVLAEAESMSMVALVPPWQQGSDSSLSYMVSTVVRELGAADSWFAVDQHGLKYERLRDYLIQQQQAAQPVCLIGTSLAFVHWFDALRKENKSFELPAASRIMDTGGFKGTERAITSAQLRDMYTSYLGVPAQRAVNEYGMTEMLSQFYDAHQRNARLMSIKQGPPWVRSAIVHPETLEPLRNDETGLLRHFDLANLFSVSALQTEDLARASADGFELLGRAAGATPRGCSIAMDMFLSATRA
jgi:hypothetical protein